MTTPIHTKKINGYLLFSSKMRIEAISQLQLQHSHPTNSTILRELSAMWKSLTPDERQLWNLYALLPS
jgi:hypothetical protein